MNTDKADLSSLSISREHRTDHSPRKAGRFVLTLVIVLLCVAALALVGTKLWSAAFSKEIEVQLVQASLHSPSEDQSLLAASGYVVAQRKAAVSSKATGLLVQLDVKEGDAVKESQIIARLQDNDIRAMVAEAKAQLDLSLADSVEAKNNLERQRKLATTSASAEAILENAASTYNRVLASIAIARARLDGAEVAEENTIVRAPFDGTVLTKTADVGEIVAPMAASLSARGAVVTIADLSSLQVEVDVSESNIEKVELNSKCDIRLDAYPTRSYPGYVASIIPTADRTKGTVLVKIGFKDYDKRVLPEMSAKVTFLKENKTDSTHAEPPVLVVPQTAIATRNGKTLTFMVKEGKAAEVAVQTGRSFNDLIEIRNGLKPGDQVIMNVSDALANGAKVVVH